MLGLLVLEESKLFTGTNWFVRKKIPDANAPLFSSACSIIGECSQWGCDPEC